MPAETAMGEEAKPKTSRKKKRRRKPREEIFTQNLRNSANVLGLVSSRRSASRTSYGPGQWAYPTSGAGSVPMERK